MRIRPTLIVMLKEPRAGRVKTRLGRDIGATAAAWWMRHQTRRLLLRLRDPRWRLVLAVAPDRAALHSRAWPADLCRVPQGRGDLGRRMRRALQWPARGPVCLIGGDIPAVRRGHIAAAFACLGDHQAVFGPATDGGYWLIGLAQPRRVPRGFLQGVRWSGPHALADTKASAANLRIALTATLADVDTVADLAFRHDDRPGAW